MAAKGIQFPRRWYGGMISVNLEVVWVMSDVCDDLKLLHIVQMKAYH